MKLHVTYKGNKVEVKNANGVTIYKIDQVHLQGRNPADVAQAIRETLANQCSCHDCVQFGFTKHPIAA